MHPDKLSILQKKLNDFLSLPPEIKHAIDTDPAYDGLFDILDELSEVVESANYNYIDFNNKISYHTVSHIDYSCTINQESHFQKAENSQNLIDISEDYAWAA